MHSTAFTVQMHIEKLKIISLRNKKDHVVNEKKIQRVFEFQIIVI